MIGIMYEMVMAKRRCYCEMPHQQLVRSMQINFLHSNNNKKMKAIIRNIMPFILQSRWECVCVRASERANLVPVVTVYGMCCWLAGWLRTSTNAFVVAQIKANSMKLQWQVTP